MCMKKCSVSIMDYHRLSQTIMRYLISWRGFYYNCWVAIMTEIVCYFIDLWMSLYCFSTKWEIMAQQHFRSKKMYEGWLRVINHLSDGGGALNAPPLKTLKIKLQSHVRGQNRGSLVRPVHLDYFQLADMCISGVFTWF